MAALDEVGSGIAYTLFVNVISQNDADKVSLDKVFGKRQCRGDAAFAFLVGVVQVLQTKRLAIAQQLQEIASVSPYCEDQDFCDTSVNYRLNRVVDFQSVVYRQQMFIYYLLHVFHTDFMYGTSEYDCYRW